MCINNQHGAIKKTEPSSTQEYAGKREEAQTEIQVIPLRHRINSSAVRVQEHWHRLPREAVDSLSMEIPKNQLGMVLGNWLWVSLLQQTGQDCLQRPLQTWAILWFTYSRFRRIVISTEKVWPQNHKRQPVHQRKPYSDSIMWIESKTSLAIISAKAQYVKDEN